MAMQDALTLAPPAPAVSREEGAALVVALAAHAALVAVLALGAPGREVQPPPKRMTVTLAEETADVSTSPVLQSDPMAGGAPEIGEVPPEELTPQPLPQPQKQTRGPQPQPTPTQPPPRQTQTKKQDKGKQGGSNFGNAFGNQDFSGRDPKPPKGEQISDQMKASARLSIGQKVQPAMEETCRSLSGPGVESLVVRIVIHLDRSGRYLSNDTPQIVEGRSPATERYIPRFIECTVAAIRRASPFNLDPASFEYWKNYPAKLKLRRN